MADLDPESLNKLRVVDLREHLSTRGLSTSGLKADLVKRLREALETETNGKYQVFFHVFALKVFVYSKSALASE